MRMMMIVKQKLLTQNPSLPSVTSPKARIFLSILQSGQLSNKWKQTLPQLLHKYVIPIHFKCRYPAAALIMTNALMMTSPLEALAQTCEADTSIFNMPLLLFVALVGATVGGLLARQRKGELQRLNEQLCQINAALRRQAKMDSYAPSLSYAPVGGRISESEVIVDPRKEELIYHLKNGKNFLRNQTPEKAFLEFKTALELAQKVNDPIEEKKAARGLGASLQRQGKYKEAIEYHSMVLDISARNGEESGSTEAYGAIADCYTSLGIWNELQNTMTNTLQGWRLNRLSTRRVAWKSWTGGQGSSCPLTLS